MCTGIFHFLKISMDESSRLQTISKMSGGCVAAKTEEGGGGWGEIVVTGVGGNHEVCAILITGGRGGGGAVFFKVSWKIAAGSKFSPIFSAKAVGYSSAPTFCQCRKLSSEMADLLSKEEMVESFQTF
jgi:hypothetical protein